MYRRTLLAVTMLSALLSPLAGHAADVPPSLSGTTLVSAEEIAKLESGGAIVIDSRVASEYADGHIKGAVSIPYREKSEKSVGFDASVDEFNVARLPPDKAAAIVIYCNGPDCWKSFKASTAAIKAGYTNVYWYRDGFPNWKSKGLPIE